MDAAQDGPGGFLSGILGVTVLCCRPLQLNAMANRAAGKGYENEDNYSNIKFQFIGIENIHVMRNSLQKMLEGKPLPGHSTGREKKKKAVECFRAKTEQDSPCMLKLCFCEDAVCTGGLRWEAYPIAVALI